MTPPLPLLTFHAIADGSSPVVFSPLRFRALMEGLAEAGWRGTTVSAALASAGDKRVVGICFDDGYRNVFEHAAPVLADLDFGATVFVVADRCGRDNRWPGQPDWVPTMDLMDWNELGEVCAAGWEVGSHGRTHVDMTTLAPAKLADELEGSRTMLEARAGHPVRLLAYPGGELNATVVDAAREVYDAACSTRLSFVTAADRTRPFALPRIDAYYLRRWPQELSLDSPVTRGYLAARAMIRRLRQL